MDKETPITKYLATLERRQARRDRDLGGYISSPSPGLSPEPRNMANIRQQLRFEDETFLQTQEDHDQSVIPCSPPSPGQLHQRPLMPTSTTNMISTLMAPTQFSSGSSLATGGGGGGTSNSFKRKRHSFEDDKEEEDHIKRICELQKLIRQTNGELVESRAMTAKLEKQKMDLRTECYEKTLNYEKSMSETRIRCRDAVERAEALQKDNDLKAAQIEELKGELYRKSTMNVDKMRSLESRVSELERANTELTQKLEEEKMTQTDSVKNLSENLSESEKGSQKWSVECQILKEQLTLKEAQAAKYLQELKEAQSKIFKLTEFTSKYEQPETTESKIASLREEIKKYENLYVREQTENAKVSQQLTKLTEENGYLRGSMNKELLLEEQIASLETEVKYLRGIAKTKAEIEVERDGLKEKLQQWVKVAQNVSPEFTRPQNFAIFLGSLQTELVQLKHDCSALNYRVESLNREVTELRSEAATAKDAEKQKTEDYEKLTSELKQLSRRLILVTKDRDGLKALKESYEQELETIISPALKQRANELENLLRDYEKIIEENPSKRGTCFECDKRISLIMELRAELEKARSCAQNISVFGDASIGDSGPGDTTGIKVVTFANNLSALSLEARVKELGSENERLKARIRHLEEQSMPGPSDTVLHQGNQIFEEQIRTLERKNQILAEAYDYETQQLQTALNKLFGYHVVLVRDPQSQFRLQSVYASGPGQELIFQEAENSDMMLLESPVLDHFRDDIDRFLLREGSIAAFLATVTLTFVQGMVQPSDASQLPVPSSQTSTATEAGESITVTQPQRKMIEVEVEGRAQTVHHEQSDADEEMEEEEDEEAEEEEEEYEGQEEEAEQEEEEEAGESGNNDSDEDVVYIESD